MNKKYEEKKKTKEYIENHAKKKYDDLKKYFYNEYEIYFTNDHNLEDFKSREKLNNEIKIKDEFRIWLLFASDDKEEWTCLQVASTQDAQKLRKEIIDIESEKEPGAMDLILEKTFDETDIQYRNSQFYNDLYPYPANYGKDNESKRIRRKLLYNRIGVDHKYFKICFLKVSDYISHLKKSGVIITDIITEDMKKEKKDEMKKDEILCAEAFLAYSTLAVYWNPFRGKIDGRAMTYISKHYGEFDDGI